MREVVYCVRSARDASSSRHCCTLSSGRNPEKYPCRSASLPPRSQCSGLERPVLRASTNTRSRPASANVRVAKPSILVAAAPGPPASTKIASSCGVFAFTTVTLRSIVRPPGRSGTGTVSAAARTIASMPLQYATRDEEFAGDVRTEQPLLRMRAGQREGLAHPQLRGRRRAGVRLASRAASRRLRRHRQRRHHRLAPPPPNPLDRGHPLG